MLWTFTFTHVDADNSQCLQMHLYKIHLIEVLKLKTKNHHFCLCAIYPEKGYRNGPWHLHSLYSLCYTPHSLMLVVHHFTSAELHRTPRAAVAPALQQGWRSPGKLTTAVIRATTMFLSEAVFGGHRMDLWGQRPPATPCWGTALCQARGAAAPAVPGPSRLYAHPCPGSPTALGEKKHLGAPSPLLENQAQKAISPLFLQKLCFIS